MYDSRLIINYSFYPEVDGRRLLIFTCISSLEVNYRLHLLP